METYIPLSPSFLFWYSFAPLFFLAEMSPFLLELKNCFAYFNNTLKKTLNLPCSFFWEEKKGLLSDNGVWGRVAKRS